MQIGQTSEYSLFVGLAGACQLLLLISCGLTANGNVSRKFPVTLQSTWGLAFKNHLKPLDYWLTPIVHVTIRNQEEIEWIHLLVM